jgi:hypothetical protein
MPSETKKIHFIKSNNWQLAFIIGAILFAISTVFNRKLFYIHHYLFITGLISLVTSYSKYAIINDEHLRLFFGIPLFRKNIILPWSQITFVETHYIRRLGLAVAGDGRGGIPYDYMQAAVLINLNKPISQAVQKAIIKQNRFQFFVEGLKLISSYGIYLEAAPQMGFRNFLIDLSQYVNTDNLDTLKSDSKFHKIVKNSFITVVLLIMAGFSLCLLYSIFS